MLSADVVPAILLQDPPQKLGLLSVAKPCHDRGFSGVNSVDLGSGAVLHALNSGFVPLVTNHPALVSNPLAQGSAAASGRCSAPSCGGSSGATPVRSMTSGFMRREQRRGLHQPQELLELHLLLHLLVRAERASVIHEAVMLTLPAHAPGCVAHAG